MSRTGIISYSPNPKYSAKTLLVTFLAMALIASMIANSILYSDLKKATLVIDVGTHSVHTSIYIQRVGGENEFWSEHAGVLTSVGKDFIEGKISNDGFANASENAKYISLSTSASAPDAAWRIIPTEITANGLDRTEGAYASTGVGTWTVSFQFTASGTHTNVQLTGLNWYTGLDASLVASDTFTAVTLNSGDKITVTWTITAT